MALLYDSMDEVPAWRGRSRAPRPHGGVPAVLRPPQERPRTAPREAVFDIADFKAIASFAGIPHGMGREP